MANMRALTHLALFTLAVGALSVSVSGCSTTPDARSEPSELLVGCWKGNDFQPVLGQNARWLMQRRADGTFVIEFLAEGRPPQQETGRWSVQGNTYTTMTQTIDNEPVDVRDPQFTDIYQLKALSAGSMTYFHSKMNITFRSVKVACPRDA